jgi:hypothetical protein
MDCAVVFGFFLLRPGWRARNEEMDCGPLMWENEPLFFGQGVEINLVLVVSFDATKTL